MQLFLPLLLLLACPFRLSAQEYADEDAPPVRFGAYAHGQETRHLTSFRALPNVPNCCVEFRGANAFSIGAGGLFDVRLMNGLYIEVRGGYSDIGAVLKEENGIGNAIIGDQAVPAFSEHSLKAVLSVLESAAMLRFRPLSGIPLFLHGGFGIGYLVERKYEQQEELVRPKGITFTNGSTIRNRLSGPIPQVNVVQSSLLGGLSAEINLSRRWVLAPELHIGYPVTAVTPAVDWKYTTWRGGISLRYSLLKMIPPPPPPPPPAPPPPPEPFLVLQLDASMEGRDGSATESRMVVDEVRYAEMYPLLPFVFFGEGDAILASTRQHLLSTEETGTFTEESLDPKTEKIYADLLNIIGYRMRKNSAPRIRIIGCTNGLGVEANNATLSVARATAVKDYLVNKWGIESRRITVTGQQLPSMPTKNDIPEGQEENRRAEMMTDDPLLLAPVRLEEIRRITVTPSVRFHPRIVSSSEITGWNFRLEQGENTILTRSGKDGPPPDLIWSSAEDVEKLTRDSIRAILEASNREGKYATASTSVAVIINNISMQRFEKRHNARIERYGLILFDFDKSALSRANTEILDIVRSRITSSSRVVIRGYADRTGSAEYNRRLSESRCQAVREYLGSSVRSGQVVIEPIGSDILIFDNNLPEGRCYNRIVYITIETPE